METAKISTVARGRAGRAGGEHRISRATETILYDTVAVEHVIIHGVNPLDLQHESKS